MRPIAIHQDSNMGPIYACVAITILSNRPLQMQYLEVNSNLSTRHRAAVLYDCLQGAQGSEHSLPRGVGLCSHLHSILFHFIIMI